jgi:acyl-CoA synthetase (NDP forming)
LNKKHELDTMFFPKSVAVVGASPNPKEFSGTTFLLRLRDLGFPGKIYPIHPNANEIIGYKTYPKVSSTPNPVDLVIVAVSAPRVPQILEDCIIAGVKNVHIFSSGFSETGEEKGRALEQQIIEIIQRGKLHVVGPNCMGLYVPASGLTAWGFKPKDTGSVAFLSQSGGHGEILTAYAQSLGVYFSKLISFGNASGLQVTDFLDYLHQDQDTEIITMYLEGIRDGNEFTQQVKEINRTKPVIIWKGGMTESGSRAIASHTGSLAGEERIWDAFFAQTGAVRANSLEEIIDVVLAFQHLGPVKRRRTLIFGFGGGNSVAYADICGREGLEIPPLSKNTRDELNTFIHLAGNSTRNPLDLWMVQWDIHNYKRVIEKAMADPSIDLAIVDRVVGDFADEFNGEEQREEMEKKILEVNDFLISFARENPYNKPLVITTNMYGNDLYSAGPAELMRREFVNRGVPAYGSLENAARALARFIKYHEFQAKTCDKT